MPQYSSLSLTSGHPRLRLPLLTMRLSGLDTQESRLFLHGHSGSKVVVLLYLSLLILLVSEGTKTSGSRYITILLARVHNCYIYSLFSSWLPYIYIYVCVCVCVCVCVRQECNDQEGERWSSSYILYKSVYVFFFFYKRVDSISDLRWYDYKRGAAMYLLAIITSSFFLRYRQVWSDRLGGLFPANRKA